MTAVKTALDQPDASAVRFPKSSGVPRTDVARAVEYVHSELADYLPRNIGSLTELSITDFARRTDRLVVYDTSAGTPKKFAIPLMALDVTHPTFGAVGDGVTDDRAAIVAADVAAAARGAMLYFPTPSVAYLISAAISPSQGAHWSGENRFETTLMIASATANLIEFTNSYARLDGFQFAANQTRSGGWFVNIAADNIELSDYYLAAPYGGIRVQSGSVIKFGEGDIVNTVNGGCSTRIDGGYAVSFKRHICSGGTTPKDHLLVTACNDLTFDKDCQFLLGKNNIRFDLQTGSVAASFEMYGWCDQATEYNYKFEMNGGSIVRSTVAGWAVGAGLANVSVNGAGGDFDGVDFSDLDNSDAPYLYAFDASSGVVSKIIVDASKLMEAATYAILANNVDGLIVRGCIGGEGAGWSATAGTFLALGGNTNHVIWDDCDVRGASTPFSNSSTGTDIRIGRNIIGYDATISPSQITSNQDNYAPSGIHHANTLRLSTDASRNITGIAAPGWSKRLKVHNIGSNPIVLVDDATSTAANRFALNGNVTVYGDESVEIEYDTTTARWRMTDSSVPFSKLVGSLGATQAGSAGFAVGFLTFTATVDFNAGNTDTAITITLPAGFTRYSVNTVIISGASASLTTATCGVFTAAAAGGTAIVASASAITVSTASEGTNNNMQQLTSINSTTNSFNVGTLYFRVQTPQGSAATATVAIRVTPIS